MTDPDALQALRALAPFAPGVVPGGDEAWAAEPAEAWGADWSRRLEAGLSPLLRRAEGAPAGAPRDLAFGREHAHGNCAVERMKSTPRFRESWWAGRRAVVLARAVSGWTYDAGRPEHWVVHAPHGQPLCLAALWQERPGAELDSELDVQFDVEGRGPLEFAWLTQPAGAHPVFARWGAPDGPRRMPALLAPEHLALWLDGSLQDAERALARSAGQPLVAHPQAPATRPRREPRSWAAVPDMFAYEWHVTACEAHPPRRSRPARTPTGPGADGPAPISGSLF
ncbi:SOS response-associated peptidase family protein [Roseateles sp. BYS87W]|uniref:SOS response-associated peptidase family protein n=1 Tax=Pelomonas baiyunensis TaxID=3299026 RepID=UPI00374A5C0F